MKFCLTILLILNGIFAQEEGFNYECRLKAETAPITLQTGRVVGSPGKMGPVGPQGPKGDKGEMPVVTDEKLRSIVTSYLESTNSEECPSYGVEGVRKIYPAPYQSNGIKVYCDTSTEGGRWIVLQRREDGSVDFYRGWNDYVHGFGSKYGEFWIGLETMHRLTQADDYELYIELFDFDGERAWAKYTTFKIGGAESKYKLTIGGYTGRPTGDSMSVHNGMKFTTKDSDNDIDKLRNCAERFTGAWWYYGCHSSNLNGKYQEDPTSTFEGSNLAKGLSFYSIKRNHYSFKFVEMKIRKIST